MLKKIKMDRPIFLLCGDILFSSLRPVITAIQREIKIGKWNGRIVNSKPEFADCAKAAEEHKTCVKDVIEAALLEFNNTQFYR